MRSVVLLNIVLAVVVPALASTSPCRTNIYGGFIEDEHWTAANSPYCLKGSIQVSLLTIDPAVEVLADGDYGIDVLTTITAVGTSAQPIRFGVRRSGQCWEGIRFQNTPAGSTLENVTIEDSQAGAVSISGGAAPVMRSILFRHNTTTTNGGAIAALGVLGDLRVESCVFEGNSASYSGGAIYVANDGGDVDVESCAFYENSSSSTGGAVYASLPAGRTLRVLNSEFVGNRSTYGSAIYDYSGDAVVSKSRFDSNNSTYYGGALFLTSSLGNASIRNCVFTNGYGPGVGIERGVADLRNNVFSCISGSGALYVQGGSVSVTNTTIARNGAYGIWTAAGTVVTNSIVFFNNGNGQQISGYPSVSYSNVQGGFGSPSDNNLNLNPVFYGLTCDPSDLVVASTSPCVDAGDPSSSQNDACFPPARGTWRNDMGALGGPAACTWVPYEIRDLRFVGPADLTWTKSRIASTYSVYRGTLQRGVWHYDQSCLSAKDTTNSFHDADPVSVGYFYLVTAWNADGESTIGDADLLPRTKCGNAVVTGVGPRPRVGICDHTP